MTPGSRYKGKTPSLPGQRWNQSPHSRSVPLESSGMDLPAWKPAHPCSWACLPPRGTQVSHTDITFCAQVEAGWAAVWAWPRLGIRGLVIFRGQRLSFQDPLSSFSRWDLLPLDTGAN